MSILKLMFSWAGPNVNFINRSTIWHLQWHNDGMQHKPSVCYNWGRNFYLSRINWSYVNKKAPTISHPLKCNLCCIHDQTQWDLKGHSSFGTQLFELTNKSNRDAHNRKKCKNLLTAQRNGATIDFTSAIAAN